MYGISNFNITRKVLLLGLLLSIFLIHPFSAFAVKNSTTVEKSKETVETPFIQKTVTTIKNLFKKKRSSTKEKIPYDDRPDKLAIVSLVLGILSFIFILPAPFAIILGIISLSRTRNTNIKGRGMAIAGIILGSIVFAVIIGLLILLLFNFLIL